MDEMTLVNHRDLICPPGMDVSLPASPPLGHNPLLLKQGVNVSLNCYQAPELSV